MPQRGRLSEGAEEEARVLLPNDVNLQAVRTCRQPVRRGKYLFVLRNTSIQMNSTLLQGLLYHLSQKLEKTRLRSIGDVDPHGSPTPWEPVWTENLSGRQKYAPRLGCAAEIKFVDVFG